jgi:uncharacterized protein YjiS (DUF1127 family)
MTRTVASSAFGSLFGAVASLTSPVEDGLSRPRYGTAARLQRRGWLAQAVDGLLAWSERSRQRRQLMQFDDHRLRDIGITRAEAIAETAKPFWRA